MSIASASTAACRWRSPPIAIRPNTSAYRRRRATRSRSRRGRTPRRNGGAKATAISTRARSGSSPTSATSRSPKAAPRTHGHCGIRPGRRCTSCPTAAGRRTSGARRRPLEAVRRRRSPASPPVMSSGRRLPATARRSRSSASSRSGRSTPRADRLTRCRLRSVVRQRRRRSTTARLPIKSASSRCRRMARRSPSSFTARFSRRRRRTAGKRSG